MNNSLDPYTYSILKFIPDMRTGEFVNVGVALHSSIGEGALIKCRSTFGRVTKLNHKVDGHGLLRTLKNISTEFRNSAERFQFEKVESVASLCDFVLPRDDSSLQWDTVRRGKCKDINGELDRLFERFVSYADEDKTLRKTEDDIWRVFNKELKMRNLDNYLKPRVFQTPDDEVKFDHAVKNGIWHCVQPVSFDLLHASSIKDKAHKWLGHIASVSNANEDFRVYFLLAEPSDKNLAKPFENAKSILKKIPSEPDLYSESASAELLDKLESVCT